MADEQPRLLHRVWNTVHVGVLAWRERKVPYWPNEWIEQMQSRRVRSIVRHAYETVPFYRRVMDERGLRVTDFQAVGDLEKLPLLDDVFVRRNADQFLSCLYAHRPRITLQTSGAYSRARKLISWDYAASLRKLALAERDRAVLNRLLGKGWGQNQIYLLPASSATFTTRSFWDRHVLTPSGLARRHVFTIEHSFEQAAEQIRLIRPDVVFAYGSYTDEFFRFLADRNLTIPLPRVWMYGADTLSAGGRELIEKKFGCIVYSTYQSVETGKLGFQCERLGGFHLNIDLCAVRLIDESGCTVGPGRTGEVVISNLYNRATVLLNYRLGDLGTLADEPCPCRRTLPLLERLEGRVNEVFPLPDGRRLIGSALEMELRDELRPTIQAQFTQVEPGAFLWRIVPFSDVNREDLRRRLLDKTRSLLGNDVNLSVEFVQYIPRTPAGKQPRIVRADEVPSPEPED